MLDQLIEFAEKLFKKDKALGVELGRIIQTLGDDLFHQKKILDGMNDEIKKLKAEKKRREH